MGVSSPLSAPAPCKNPRTFSMSPARGLCTRIHSSTIQSASTSGCDCQGLRARAAHNHANATAQKASTLNLQCLWEIVCVIFLGPCAYLLECLPGRWLLNGEHGNPATITSHLCGTMHFPCAWHLHDWPATLQTSERLSKMCVAAGRVAWRNS